MCPAWSPIAFVELVLQALLGLATVTLAWKCRNLFSEFNESAPILFVTLSLGLSALLVFAVKTMAVLDPRTEYLFDVFTLLATTSVTVTILPGYKLLPCFRRQGSLLSFEEWKQRVGGAIGGVRRASFSRRRSLGRRSDMNLTAEIESVSADAAATQVDAGLGHAPASPVRLLEAAEVRVKRDVSRIAEEGATDENTAEVVVHAPTRASSKVDAACADPNVAADSLGVASRSHASELKLHKLSSCRKSDANRSRALGSVGQGVHRVWVSFCVWDGAYMTLTDELRTALSNLEREDEALASTLSKLPAGQRQGGSVLGPFAGGSVRGSTSMSSIPKSPRSPPSLLARKFAALHERGSSVRGSVGNAPALPAPSPAPGSPASLVAVNVALSGDKSVTLPMTSQTLGRSASPIALLEQPGCLLQLVNERIDECRAQASRVSDIDAMRIRAGNLQEASRSRISDSRWRVLRIPPLQLAFKLIMLAVAALVITEGVASVAAALGESTLQGAVLLSTPGNASTFDTPAHRGSGDACRSWSRRRSPPCRSASRRAA